MAVLDLRHSRCPDGFAFSTPQRAGGGVNRRIAHSTLSRVDQPTMARGCGLEGSNSASIAGKRESRSARVFYLTYAGLDPRRGRCSLPSKLP